MVPVGEDQVQHIELTRHLARAFNHQFGTHTFPIPRVALTRTRRVKSLRDPLQKMSKSAPDPMSRILITDDADSIKAKVGRAVTDSQAGITYEPESRPGLANLLEILCEVKGGSATPQTLASEYASAGTAEFKRVLTEALVEQLAPLRARYLRVIADKAYLDEVARNGAQRAAHRAANTLSHVKKAIGLE